MNPHEHCVDCGKTLIPFNRWRALSRTAKEDHRQRGIEPHKGRGLCARCHNRRRLHDELVDLERSNRTIEEVIEDFDQLDLNRELSLNRRFHIAAPRLGMTYSALQKAYYRALKNGKWAA